MNFICKIIEDRPNDQQIIAKFCRQNAPKSIDEYPSYAIDYSKIDFSDYESFVHSILLSGHQIIINQFISEPSLPSNLEVSETNSTNIADNLNKILFRDGKVIIPSESYYYKMLMSVAKLNENDINDVLNQEEVSDLLNKIDLHKRGEKDLYQWGKERSRNEDGTYVADDPSTPDVNEAWVTSEEPKKKTKRGRKKSSET